MDLTKFLDRFFFSYERILLSYFRWKITGNKKSLSLSKSSCNYLTTSLNWMLWQLTVFTLRAQVTDMLEVSTGSLWWEYGLWTCQLLWVSQKLVSVFTDYWSQQEWWEEKKKSDRGQLCQLCINSIDGVMEQESFNFLPAGQFSCIRYFS